MLGQLPYGVAEQDRYCKDLERKEAKIIILLTFFNMLPWAYQTYFQRRAKFSREGENTNGIFIKIS